MLVLSRKKQDIIVISDGPDQISVQVLDVRGGVVKIGIVAPQTVAVRRGELRPRESREKLMKTATSLAGSCMRPIPSVAGDRRTIHSLDA